MREQAWRSNAMKIIMVQISLLIALCAGALSAEQKFPEWRGKQLELPGLWETTPIVAVGDVTNVVEFGVQTVDHLPYPAIQDIHKLYWCQGDFRATAVVKG